MGVNVRGGRWTEVGRAGFDGVDSELGMGAQIAENMIGKIVFGVDVRKSINQVDNVIVLWKAKTSEQGGNMRWNYAF